MHSSFGTYLYVYHFRFIRQRQGQSYFLFSEQRCSAFLICRYMCSDHIYVQTRYEGNFIIKTFNQVGGHKGSVLWSAFEIRICALPMIFIFNFSQTQSCGIPLVDGEVLDRWREIAHYTNTASPCVSGHYILLEILPIAFVYMAFRRQAHENSTPRLSQQDVGQHWMKNHTVAFSTSSSLKW